MSDSTVDVEVVYQYETTGAFLVAADEETEPVWLPKSLVEMEEPDSSEDGYTKGFLYSVTLPQWLAEREGLV